MIKFNFIFDKTNKSLSFKKKILKKYKNYSIKYADCIIVAGGDGFMLQTLKKNYQYNKPFYGINCGTYGFLMNKSDNKDLQIKIKKSKRITINPIIIRAVSKNNKIIRLIAVNVNANPDENSYRVWIEFYVVNHPTPVIIDTFLERLR